MEKDKNLAQVFHYDLYGKRAEKYDFLLNNNLQTVKWRELELTEPLYFFVAKDFSQKGEYDKGFSVQELFPVNSLGLITKRDGLSIAFSEKELMSKMSFFLDDNNPIQDVCNHFEIPLKDKDKWNAIISRTNTKIQNVKEQIENILYRPFDIRKVFYNKCFVARLNKKVLRNLQNANCAIIIGRQGQAVGEVGGWNIVSITNSIVDQNIFYRGGGSVFPLYLYPETDNFFSDKKRKPNLKEEIIDDISQRIGARFTEEKEDTENTFAPIDVLDYIYAILHSPAYRERYKEFLKIDFPRVPYPENSEKFWALAALGGKLRRLHLMEGVEPQNGLADFPVIGSCEVEKLQYISARHCGLDPQSQEKRDCQEIAGQARNDGRVYINDKQYFDHVPPEAWNFYIGGYQPAQKWLKDRKGRMLGYDDIWHYQRIIRVLWETGEVMREVDETLE